MAPTKKTYFQLSWLDKYLWLQEADCRWEAFCKLCQKKFSLSNMGEKAVTSHSDGRMHKLNVLGQASSGIKKFFQRPSENSKNSVKLVPSTSQSSVLRAGSPGKNLLFS